jgi:hypothetical protein
MIPGVSPLPNIFPLGEREPILSPDNLVTIAHRHDQERLVLRR